MSDKALKNKNKGYFCIFHTKKQYFTIIKGVLSSKSQIEIYGMKEEFIKKQQKSIRNSRYPYLIEDSYKTEAILNSNNFELDSRMDNVIPNNIDDIYSLNVEHDSIGEIKNSEVIVGDLESYSQENKSKIDELLAKMDGFQGAPQKSGNAR